MKKGQFTVVALISVLVVLIFFGALYPTIKAQIDTLTPTLDPTTATVLNLLPFFIVVAIILGVIFYALPVSAVGTRQR